MRDFCKLIRRMGIQRKYVILLLLRSPFDALRTWMLANLMKSVFLCLETEKTGSLFQICALYGLLCGVLFLYNGVVWSRYAAFSAKAEAMLQKSMVEKILGLPLKRVASRLSGEWMTNLNSDIQTAFIMMNGPLNIPHLITAAINIVLSSLLLFGNSPLLLGVTWVFVLPQLFLNYKLALKPIPKLKEQAQNALSENTSAILPLITEADTILIYDAKELMLRTCEASSRRLMKINMNIHMRNALNNMGMNLLGFGGYLAILLLGYRVMAFSDVIYCLQVRGAVLAGMSMLITCLNNLKANSVCVRRINDVLEE